MSKKYIKQVNSYNFIYPNNTVPEYDVEIIHNVNDNSVNGTITSVSATTVTLTGITVTWAGTWNLNGAEPFISPDNTVRQVSVHCMVPNKTYFKPWTLVDYEYGTIGTTSRTFTQPATNFALTPSQFGLSTFTNGTYYLEFRMISKRSVLPICASFVVSTLTPPTPTPTPTSSPTPTATPTPTPTPTIGPVTPTPTPVGYDLYLADEYACTFPGCALQRVDVVVALPSGTTPNYGKFYPDASASGFAYLLTTTTSGGPGIILDLGNYTACNSACAV